MVYIRERQKMQGGTQKTKKEAKEANQKMFAEVKEREQELRKEERKTEQELRKRREKERNETTLRQRVEELKKEREDDRARAEKDKHSMAAEMTKKLKSKQQNVDTLTQTVGKKERNETTLSQQAEELKKGREEYRARAEKDKRSIELSWKKKHDYKEQLLEQLKRETWKLRTKIQLDSEIRSAEQKKKAETHQWSLIPWVTSGKQAQGGVTEEQIHSEYANEDVNNQQLFNRDDTSLERDRTKGYTDIQALQEATTSSNQTPRDGHKGNMASKTQEDLTDGSRNQHLDQSPERSTEDFDESEVTSEEVSSEEFHPGDDMNNVSSIHLSEQSPSHGMQVLPDDMSEIAPLVSYGGNPNEESTILDTSHRFTEESLHFWKTQNDFRSKKQSNLGPHERGRVIYMCTTMVATIMIFKKACTKAGSDNQKPIQSSRRPVLLNEATQPVNASVPPATLCYPFTPMEQGPLPSVNSGRRAEVSPLSLLHIIQVLPCVVEKMNA
eukprot:XP_011681421.1 PREDICTED: RNA-binding protein 25-like [Strongylocentrotus purpuratus]